MNTLHWSEAIQQCHKRGEAYAIATVMGVAGSTPREPGSKMVITESTSYSTIGGGQLEFAVMLKARELLLKGEAAQQIEAFPLAATGQCCGGNVSVLLEIIPATAWQVWVYGAGHVAQQLITVLGGLPCQVHWCDSRAELFPEQLPANVICHSEQDLVATVERIPNNADVLVLTHDHSLDFNLSQAVLSRHLWLGLIGSNTKAKRFTARLEKAGINQEQLAELHCPVGLSEVPGKLPMEVAVSIAGQLIAKQHAKANSNQAATRRGLHWKELHAALTTHKETQHG